MPPKKKILINTAATYLTSVTSFLLALFSNRWVLWALGHTDYGLFSLVAALTVFITFLNMVLSGSVSRFLAFALGQGEVAEVNAWFNAALSFHFALGILLALVGFFIGDQVLKHGLNIPPDRLGSCATIFRLSLISLFAGMASSPYIGMFQAKQRIYLSSVWRLTQTILSFILAWCLLRVSGDRLIIYGAGMAGISIVVLLAQVVQAHHLFEECALDRRYWFDKQRLKRLFSFGGWNLFGTLGALLRDQGSMILLNLFHGATANAAYGIARQVSIRSTELGSAMLVSVAPEITTREGQGDRAGMLRLALQTSRFGTLLVTIFFVPLVLEMDYVLSVWLRNPPPFTAPLCRLILVTFVVDRLTAGYMLATQAKGKIAGYQATLGTVLILTMPLCWLLLRMGLGPVSVGYSIMTTMVVCSMGRVLWARGLFGLPVLHWVRSVLFPCALVIASMFLLGLTCIMLLAPSMGRLLAVVGTTSLAWLIASWNVAFTASERAVVLSNVLALPRRLSLYITKSSS